MIPRVRSAGLALLAMLAVASPCLAGEGMGPGRGGIGGQIGGSLFWADTDYSEGARPRLAFSGHFRYVLNSRLRWQVSPGFTWSGYSSTAAKPFVNVQFPAELSKNSQLTLLLPMTLEIQYLLRRGKWHYHVGAGPGIYRIWIQDHRLVLFDPSTFVKHRALHPGVTGEIGVERFFKSLPSTSIEACVATHWVFAERDQDYPLGYNSFLAVTELRLGANYYFDMSRLKRQPSLPPSSGR